MEASSCFFMFIMMMASIAGDCNVQTSQIVFAFFGVCCRDPRGFGFIQYVDPADAAEAKHHMEGYLLLGRELTVVFAEENRKKPTEMRTRDRGGRSVSPQERRYEKERSYSRSPPRNGSRARSGSREKVKKSYSRSRSPRRSVSPRRNRSYTPEQARSPVPRQSRSPSPRGERNGDRSPSQ
ncbi:Serine/arginine-rich SC35-like splicing factor SCL30A [Raphanus sativus]|nr:Serine/arginine-rich SC35-like splicing factor SCL30A [Raphanus sativus]